MKSEKSRKSWFRQLMNGQVRVGDAGKYEIRGEDLGMVAEGTEKYGRY